MIGQQAARRAVKVATVKAQNMMSRKMSAAEKLMREISAEYTGRSIVEISTGLHGTIAKIEYDYTVWNSVERRDGCWMVYMTYDAVPPLKEASTPGAWLSVYGVGLVD